MRLDLLVFYLFFEAACSMFFLIGLGGENRIYARVNFSVLRSRSLLMLAAIIGVLYLQAKATGRSFDYVTL
jgi:NADH:ubiquinone oxidoreductase subunit 4 (subunit M)